ncbi:MAG: type II toxin-antitoxin system prevent-host-death family antitoxin [Deltaproteobacteria bacterium]|nr:type II toxin-antitoxin system prevent-host-death family antitoxin [Deltaproteobacteria bacterium]
MVNFMEINVKEARSKLSSLLDRVEEGTEVILLRRGKEVARLVPPSGMGRRLPSLSDFRSSIKTRGIPLSETVIKGRQEERD